MANTYELIDSTTVGSSGASSIIFTNIGSIPNTFTDLLIKISARVDQSGAPNVCLRFNSDTGSNYKYKTAFGDGTSPGSYSEVDTGNTFINLGYGNNSSHTSNTFGNLEVVIPNYTDSKYKLTTSESVQENNNATAYMMITCGYWNNTNAITSITLFNQNSGYKWTEHTTASLYGIKNS